MTFYIFSFVLIKNKTSKDSASFNKKVIILKTLYPTKTENAIFWHKEIFLLIKTLTNTIIKNKKLTMANLNLNTYT